MYDEEIAYAEPAPALAPDPLSSWIKWGLWGFGILMPFLILFVVSRDLQATCFLAYLNCMILGFTFRIFIKRQDLIAMVPFVFLGYLFFSMSFSILYFALVNPEAAYFRLTSGYVSFFTKGVRYQLVVLLFLIGYLSMVFLALRKSPVTPATATPPSRFALTMIAFFVMFVIFLNITTRFITLPSVIQYFSVGLYNYLYGLPFILGVYYKQFSKIMKIVLISFFACAMLIYTVGNARGAAVYPTALMILGLLLFGEMSNKIKKVIIISVLVGFPMYFFLGNVTRTLLGTVGFEEGFQYRLQTLRRWREVSGQMNVLDNMFGRLFFTGGHTIITQSPEQVPYRNFDAGS